MLELRITVLRDKPELQKLNDVSAQGYSLFRDTNNGLYFLTSGATDDFDLDGFGSDYHRVCDIPFEYDASHLAAFKANHQDVLEHTLIHDEILIDALALSATFSTRVLCVYSNDEDCDFAVTAENGKLLRLRFKAGRTQGQQVDEDSAAQIETEIHAVRILMDGEDAGDDAVFEYTAFEAIQTQDKPLDLYPFWTYREGEIGGRVIFDTLSSTPKDTDPALIFRNAFLEFKEAFGKTPPDFTDMPEAGRFQRTAFQAPSKTSFFAKVSHFVKSLLSIMTGSRKAMLWTLGIALVLLVAIFGKDNERPKKQSTFAGYCAAAGGSLPGEADAVCVIDGVAYRHWSLPGVKGERRVMILKVGPQQVPCSDVDTRQCLMVDGGVFYDTIEGFTFQPGKLQILPAERIQICDPATLNDCPQDAGIFRYKQLFSPNK